MDPEATYAILMEHARSLIAQLDGSDPPVIDADDVDTLASAVIALDTALTRGMMLPRAWQHR